MLGQCADGREASEVCDPCLSEFDMVGQSCKGTDLQNVDVLKVRMSCFKDGDELCKDNLTMPGCSQCQKQSFRLLKDEGILDYYMPSIGKEQGDIDSCLESNEEMSSSSGTLSSSTPRVGLELSGHKDKDFGTIGLFVQYY